jgi:beta-glucosidase
MRHYILKILTIISLLIMVMLISAFNKNTVKSVSLKNIYHDEWNDLNKNGRMDPYENPALDTDSRINDLLHQMTLEEKTCQMATLYGFGRVAKDELPTEEWLEEIWKDGIANIDEHLNGLDRPETQTQYSWPPSKHAWAINEVQKFFVEKTRLVFQSILPMKEYAVFVIKRRLPFRLRLE